MKRREFLTFSLSTAAVAAISTGARADAQPKEIRIGTQKGGFFPAVRQRHTVEDAFAPLGIEADSGLAVAFSFACRQKRRLRAKPGIEVHAVVVLHAEQLRDEPDRLHV